MNPLSTECLWEQGSNGLQIVLMIFWKVQFKKHKDVYKHLMQKMDRR